LSGTLSPTLGVELVGKAHRTVVGYPHPEQKLAVSAQALRLGRNCVGIVKLKANQLQAFAKNAEVLTGAWFPTRFDLRVI
jgi:hypothetical protein